MVAMTLVFALGLGYFAGLATGGIHISKYEIVEEVMVKPEDQPEPTESSANLRLNGEDYVTFAKETNGRIDY